MEQARAKAAEILQQADQAIAESEAASYSACAQIKAAASQSAERQAEAVLNRARSMAALAARKTLLQTRQDLIDQVIAGAITHIRQLPKPVKLSFYRNLLRRSGMTAGEVVLCTADLPLGEDLLEAGSGLHLAATGGSFAGGLMIRSGLIEENLTLDILVKNNRPALVALAAACLADPVPASDDPAGCAL
jgi:vacuolar-type H+-ATPase subunit E/Vma4